MPVSVAVWRGLTLVCSSRLVGVVSVTVPHTALLCSARPLPDALSPLLFCRVHSHSRQQVSSAVRRCFGFGSARRLLPLAAESRSYSTLLYSWRLGLQLQAAQRRLMNHVSVARPHSRSGNVGARIERSDESGLEFSPSQSLVSQKRDEIS